MFLRYHRYGITSLCVGAGTEASFRMYQELSNKNMLTMRIVQNIVFRAHGGNIKGTMETLKNNGMVTGYGDKWVRIGALKVFLDGGILTGTAYLDEPWGKRASDIFRIEDPGYRGEINYSRSELLPIVRAASEYNWKFTAHGNFFSDRNIQRMKKLGVYADIQPAWFYKDADAMEYILGKERIREFHPYRSLVHGGVMMNGGSDHMVGFDANSSINPYNPFLAMWTMVNRITERGSRIVPSEAISRKEALRIYTINNAYASFEETYKGSLEPGKLADMAILSENLLACPADQIRNIYSELTIVGGKIVYSSGKVEHVKPYDHE